MRSCRSVRVLAVSLLLAAVCLPASRAHGYAWQSIGPRGLTARVLAVDANPQVIYAAGPAGVSRSLDGGITWTGPSTFVPLGYVFDVGADPSTPGTIYGTGGYEGSCGIHCVTVTIVIAKSTNGGTSWSIVHSETAENAFPGLSWFARAAIAVDPTSSQIIHVAGWVRSVDGGTTWTPVTGVPEGAWSMVVDPANPQVVYASVGPEESLSGGIFKSTDGGATFASATANLGNVGAPDLSLDPTTGVLYVAAWGGLFRSDDGAASWTPTASLPQRPITVAAKSGVIWVGTRGTRAPNPLVAGSVFRSFDDGASWQEWASGVPHLPVMGTSINDVVLHPTSGTVWVGLDSFGVFWNDGPPAWRYANNGVERRAVNKLVFDPTPPGTLYAATELGLYRSRNRGASWAPAIDGFGGPIAVPLAFDPFQPTTLFAAAARTPDFFSSAGLFRTVDSGTTWTAWNAGLGLGQADVLSIAFDPVTPGTVYLGHGVTGLSKSTNGGATWTNTSFSQFSAETLLIDPSVPATLYAASTIYGVTKSVDGGASWASANTGIADTRVEALVLDPNDPQRLYADTAGSPPLVTTNDGAASWTPVASLAITPQSIAVNPATSAVYAGANGSVVEAPAGGAAWSPVGDTLPFTVVRTLAVEPAGTMLFAGGADFGGGDVAWLQLTPCATAADCDDGNGCTTDACDIPSGTCTYTTLDDGTSCSDDADACSEGLCAGGACRPDPCSACNGAPDADGDGVTDTCDPLDGSLTIRVAKITRDPTRGSVSIKGSVVLGPSPDAVSAAGGITLDVVAGGNPIAAVIWSPATCRVRSGGRFTCTSTDRHAKVKVTPSSKMPATPKLAAKVRGLAVPTVPAAPVAVTLGEPGRSIDRAGEIATCTPGSASLVCRVP